MLHVAALMSNSVEILLKQEADVCNSFLRTGG